MGFIQQFKSLPVYSKRLLGIGAVLAFVVALPLFVWGIVSQRFELREKASVAPTCQPRPTCLDATPHPCEIPEPEGGWCPLATDDIFFKPEGNSVIFTTTDQSPNISIAPENLIAGKTYVLQVIYSLQNNLKSQNASALKIPIDILIDDVFKSTKEIPYSLIANHRDGASDIQTASFTAQSTNTKLSVLFDPNNIFPETNETNNVLVFNFPRATATPSPTPTAPPVGGLEGEPNSCGGTCGSKYNCGANLFCYRGFCRNPICPTDTDCACSTPSPTPKSTPKKTSSPSPTPTMTIIYLTSEPSTSPSAIPTPTSTPSAAPLATDTGKPNFNFLLYIAAGSFFLSMILFIISLMKNKRGFAPLALILAVALPLFVWAVATGNFNLNKRAASGEPTPTPWISSTPTATPSTCAITMHEVDLTPHSQSEIAGSQLKYTISVKNNNSGNCGKTKYYLSAKALNGWVVALSNTILELEAGKTGTAQVIFTSPKTTPTGKYPVSVIAKGPLGNAIATATYEVIKPPIPIQTILPPPIKVD